jgi:hypothetical protein
MARPHCSDWSSISEAGIKERTRSLNRVTNRARLLWRRQLKMRWNHRYLYQVKQADRLDQNGAGMWLAVVHLTSDGMGL